jgi:hypothetical protein
MKTLRRVQPRWGGNPLGLKHLTDKSSSQGGVDSSFKVSVLRQT